jgi:hypothetical protein
MPKTIAVVKLPEILGNGSIHLVKLAGKIDSFSLLLRETPEGELKRSIEVQFHSMVFATRKEIRKSCPRYRSLPGEGILDFNTDCASAQLEPGDLGQSPHVLLGGASKALWHDQLGKCRSGRPESYLQNRGGKRANGNWTNCTIPSIAAKFSGPTGKGQLGQWRPRRAPVYCALS